LVNGFAAGPAPAGFGAMAAPAAAVAIPVVLAAVVLAPVLATLPRRVTITVINRTPQDVHLRDKIEVEGTVSAPGTIPPNGTGTVVCSGRPGHRCAFSCHGGDKVWHIMGTNALTSRAMFGVRMGPQTIDAAYDSVWSWEADEDNEHFTTTTVDRSDNSRVTVVLRHEPEAEENDAEEDGEEEEEEEEVDENDAAGPRKRRRLDAGSE
jgi:hypothetical protein